MELAGCRCPLVFDWTSKVGCGREHRAVQGQGPGVQGRLGSTVPNIESIGSQGTATDLLSCGWRFLE